MTRDSLYWWIGILGGTASALVAHFDLFPWLPERWQHGIELVAFLSAVVSGKLAWSPLPRSGQTRGGQ